MAQGQNCLSQQTSWSSLCLWERTERAGCFMMLSQFRASGPFAHWDILDGKSSWKPQKETGRPLGPISVDTPRYSSHPTSRGCAPQKLCYVDHPWNSHGFDLQSHRDCQTKAAVKRDVHRSFGSNGFPLVLSMVQILWLIMIFPIEQAICWSILGVHWYTQWLWWLRDAIRHDSTMHAMPGTTTFSGYSMAWPRDHAQNVQKPIGGCFQYVIHLK